MLFIFEEVVKHRSPSNNDDSTLSNIVIEIEGGGVIKWQDWNA